MPATAIRRREVRTSSRQPGYRSAINGRNSAKLRNSRCSSPGREAHLLVSSLVKPCWSHPAPRKRIAILLPMVDPEIQLQALQQQLEEARDEAELNLLQLQQVQEELEHYFLAHQEQAEELSRYHQLQHQAEALVNALLQRLEA